MCAARNSPWLLLVNYVRADTAYFGCFSIAIMMFIVNFEVPVVVTALVAITDDLGGFDSIGWVVASYLLGYVGQ